MRNTVFDEFIKVPQQDQSTQFCEAYVAKDWRVFPYVREDLQTPAMCRSAVSQNWQAFQFVREDLQSEGLAVAALRQDIRAFSFVSDANCTDKVYLALLAHSPAAINLIPLDRRQRIAQEMNSIVKCSLLQDGDFKQKMQDITTHSSDRQKTDMRISR